MATKEKLEIVEGPSKWDLIVALGEKGKRVRFTLKSLGGRKYTPPPLYGPSFPKELVSQGVEITAEVWLQGLETEDGSHESWLIKGRFDSRLEIQDGGPAHEFEGYYHSRTRKGNITVICDKSRELAPL